MLLNIYQMLLLLMCLSSQYANGDDVAAMAAKLRLLSSFIQTSQGELTFFVGKAAISQTSSTQQLYDDFSNPNETYTYTDKEALNFVAIKAWSKSKIQIFAFFNKPTNATDKLSLLYDGNNIFDCDATGAISASTHFESNATVKVVKVSEKLLKADEPDVIQCDSVVITEKDASFKLSHFDDLTKDWIMKIGTADVIKGKASKNILDKVRCDPGRLEKSTDYNNSEFEYQDPNIQIGSSDTTIYKTKMDCPTTFTMMYKTGTDDFKEAKNIECKAIENNNVKRYAYLTDINEEIVGENPIEVKCQTINCQKCTKPPDAICPRCKSLPDLAVPENGKCKELNLKNCSKLVFINQAYHKAINVKDVLCNNEKKFVFGADEITSVACVDKYPIDKFSLDFTEPKLPGNVATSMPVNCDKEGGCVCSEDGSRVAFLNKNQTWIRVENITFDSDNGNWKYIRKVKDELSTFVLNHTEKVVRCVGDLQQLPIVPNPKSAMVYYVSIGLLAFAVAATIPAVIVFVNFREMKRMVHKAKKENEKANKKKAKSEDKKEEDKKT